MDLTFEEISELGGRIGSIAFGSLEPDVLSLEFSGALSGAVALPFKTGDFLRVLQDGECVFRGWVTEVQPARSSHVWVTQVEVQNVVGLLDALPVERSSYSGGQRLESARGVIEQALEGARRCSLLDDERFEVSVDAAIMAVFSAGTESVWSNILAATRWIPNAASWYDHSAGVLHFVGGAVVAGSTARGRVVFGLPPYSGLLKVGSSELVMTDEWTEEPAAMAARMLLGSTEVAATAADAFTLELEARAPGAAGNGLILEYAAGNANGGGEYVEPFSGGTDSEGLQLASLESLQQADLPGSVVSVSSSERAWVEPPVVALRGAVEFTMPEGASIYQPGAFVYHVPKVPLSVGADDLQELSSEAQKMTGEWNLVKGWGVPQGWGSTGANMQGSVSNGAAWMTFWRKFVPELRCVNGSCVTFGEAVFEPMPVEEAYPEDPEDDESNSLAEVYKWRPKLLEKRNGPANYREFAPGSPENIYVCYEGSFPASSELRGCVDGLHFCRGTLRQYVWLSGDFAGTLRGPEVGKFFDGCLKFGTAETAYTCLTLSGVFINKRRVRYQSGTLGQPGLGEDAGTPETPEEPEGGSSGAGALTQRDYEQVARDYYYSSRAVGTHGSMQLAEVFRYRHGAHMGVLRSARWVPETGALTLQTGASGPLGVDALLQRQQLGRQQAVADLQESAAQKSQKGEQEAPDEDDDEEEFPMVAGTASASHQAWHAGARVAPFAVYMDDKGRMLINGGPLPSPTGVIDVDPMDISDLWRQGRRFFVKARWNNDSKKYEPVVLYLD